MCARGLNQHVYMCTYEYIMKGKENNLAIKFAKYNEFLIALSASTNKALCQIAVLGNQKINILYIDIDVY